MGLKTYARFLKLEHTLFSLPILYAGAFLAVRGVPSPKVLILILIAGAGARTAALSLNRLIDRKLDALNPRTARRELPSGTMSPAEAWGLAVTGAVIYVIAAGTLNRLCLLLSPIPLLLFAGYPYLKRVSPLSHLGLGLTWSTAPLGGWLAVTGTLDGIGPALLLAGFSLAWLSGFDIIYSTLDEAVDRETGVRALPAAIGRERALAVSGWLHALAFLALAALYLWQFPRGGPLPFLLLAGGLLYLEHHKADDVNLAFFKVNAVLGFVVLAFIVAGVLG